MEENKIAIRTDIAFETLALANIALRERVEALEEMVCGLNDDLEALEETCGTKKTPETKI